MHSSQRQFIHHVWTCLLLLVMSLTVSGCDALGFMVYALNGPETEIVPAEYAGLSNSRFAVLVSADANTLYQSPEAPNAICSAVTRELATKVPGCIVLQPSKVNTFMEENPYWSTIPYDRLLKQLAVEQLIIIDIVQYQIHDKGNGSVFKGTAIANVSVAKPSEGNTLVYSKTVKATYPSGSSVGMVAAEEQSFRLALLQNLTTTIGHLFHEYTIIHE